MQTWWEQVIANIGSFRRGTPINLVVSGAPASEAKPASIEIRPGRAPPRPVPPRPRML